MKKKFIFTFACVVAFIAGIVSCTNDDFEECVPVAEMQKNAITRSVTNEITMEEVKARVARLNKTYGVNFIINESVDANEYDEFFFNILENAMRKNVGLEPIDYEPRTISALNLMNDSAIDDVEITSTDNSPENDVVNDPYKIYEGAATSYESMDVNGYKEFSSHFNKYMWTISYSFKYGARSQVLFTGFGNQTDYDVDNMPSKYSNLYPSEVMKYAENYQMGYVEGSLSHSPIISFDNLDPENTDKVDFGYYYQFTIGVATFEAVARHNSRASGINQIN